MLRMAVKRLEPIELMSPRSLQFEGTFSFEGDEQKKKFLLTTDFKIAVVDSLYLLPLNAIFERFFMVPH